MFIWPFRKVSPRELLQRQLDHAHAQAIHHDQAAETHKAIAALNRKRMRKVKSEIDSLDKGMSAVPVVMPPDVVDLISVRAHRAD